VIGGGADGFFVCQNARSDHLTHTLMALSRKYQQVRAQDYFHSELGNLVRVRLMNARGGFAS